VNVSGEPSTIARRAREREIQRQIGYNRIRRAAVGRLPTLLPDYLRMLLGSLLGFAVLAELLRYFADVPPLYLLPAFGLLYSTQASFYKYKLAADPDFKVPTCGCAGAANDKTEAVLRSSESTVLGVPNSVLGTALYAALLLLVYLQHDVAAIVPAIAAVLGSAYLSYVMVGKIASLCPICINIAALNVLILVQFAR
jgi:uncharacterized membrane protein